MNLKLNHVAEPHVTGYQNGSDLLPEAKRLRTRSVIKESLQYKNKGFPGTDKTES